MAGIFSERAWNKVWLYRTGFLKGLGTTAETAVFGLILALALGILFGLMATSNKKVLRGISRVYVEFFQNTPVLHPCHGLHCTGHLPWRVYGRGGSQRHSGGSQGAV